MGVLVPNNGSPLRNAEYGAFANLPTRRERRAALRAYKKYVKKHLKVKAKQGIQVPQHGA